MRHDLHSPRIHPMRSPFHMRSPRPSPMHSRMHFPTSMQTTCGACHRASQYCGWLLVEGRCDMTFADEYSWATEGIDVLTHLSEIGCMDDGSSAPVDTCQQCVQAGRSWQVGTKSTGSVALNSAAPNANTKP